MGFAICNVSKKDYYLSKLESQTERFNNGENLKREEIERLLMENKTFHRYVADIRDHIYEFNEPFKSDNFWEDRLKYLESIK